MEKPRYKYPRTPHLPWSQGLSSDDKLISSAGMAHLRSCKRVIVSIKYDGENTTMCSDIIHARSVDGRSHPSRDWAKAVWGGIRADIPENFRICIENTYAKHSIHYTDLETYLWGLSVWDERNVSLDYDSTIEWFQLLGIIPATVLYDGPWDESLIKRLWTEADWATVEGYVVRDAGEISYADFGLKIAKFVRAGHVQTDEHWSAGEIVPNLLRVK